jgi:pimeloyl-ACP methyl ester carboxylesterase
MLTYEHTTIAVNGVRLHTVAAGPVNGPLVVLLHGFPDFWYGWRRQIGPLAEAGYRVVAPDQRGYNLSDKPAGLDAYCLDRLAADVVALIAAQGRDRAAAVIGHDWGAAVAWWTAIRHPSWLDRLGILNVPHPLLLRQYVFTHPRQLLRSWYVFFFQLPWLPEALARQGDYRNPAALLRDTSRPGSFTDADLAYYHDAWAQPGALTAMVNWYRAFARRPPHLPADTRVHVPTLILWGRHDVALDAALAPRSRDLCDDARLVMFDDATHWVQHDEADRVNALLAEFVGDRG